MKKCVLVVDDEQMILDGLEKFLTRKGLHVLTALNGEKACELMKEHSIDVIVSDMRMGPGDGIQVFNASRKLSPPPPVIILSGFSEADRQDLLSLGVSEIYEKPFDRKVLLETIQRLMSKPT